MAISTLLSVSSFTLSSSSSTKPHLLTSTPTSRVYSSSTSPKLKQNRFLQSQQSFSLFHPLRRNFTTLCSSPDGFLRKTKEDEEGNEIIQLPSIGVNPVKFAICVVLWASFSLLWFARSGDAKAATDSIKSSSFGLRIASTLRRFGWPDEAVVFALATLPVIELRGAIPVGYWMQLRPMVLTFFSVLGNMVPVPFIVLYLKKFATFVAGKSQTASKLLDILFKRAKEKAGPVEEFQWLGLMLFVAVPFPGTGAWTGAIIASILDMPFWPAVSSNFCGVVLAGLLVNLLVNLGLKQAIVAGIALFFVSTFMWSVLRNIRKSIIKPSLP
ncbi:putative small multi-drug export [Arabidopsis thaliana x Arabidopsis arenosa]|uniref:Putative small multi-drug export n=1 Tax=Arabidopsis thaliana x Arabidopsis arenosa TaxID=1240361 RepID=A0A8T1ZGX6_9BRAS|nr:putative small multi-drug export [Arabidopsis thaliana x Arabidopsis arenosa]